MSKMKKVLEFITKEGYTINEEGVVKNPKGKILSGSKSDGYLKFSVRTDFTSSYAMRFHKFQAYTKFGDKIFIKKNVVRHLNGIKTDNSYDNIEIGTQSDNIMDRLEKDRKGHVKNKEGIPDDIKKKIIKDREDSISYRKLAIKYGFPKSTIMDMIKKESK